MIPSPPDSTPPDRLGLMLEAVKKSMGEEDEARAQSGRSRIIDEKEGQKFIDFTLDRLFEEAGGEIEEVVYVVRPGR